VRLVTVASGVQVANSVVAWSLAGLPTSAVGNDGLGVQAQLDDLEGDAAPDRCLRFGHIDAV
jgi:hypothetical protein